MTSLPIFSVTRVGSWPRPAWLLQAQRRKRRGELGAESFAHLADRAVLDVLRLQELAGADLVTDGEQRRDNFYSFVAERLEGVRLMTLAEMLDVVEDRQGFERILQTLDVPSFAISNATCVGRVSRRASLVLDDLRVLRRHTQRPIKVTLPGPYLLTRSMFVPAASAAAYATKEELSQDVVGVLRDEIEELVEAGVDFIQLDEPVLTELVFTQGQTRTFMCAALAARNDPAEELELAMTLINQVAEAARGVRLGVHVCRGNWSRDESTLLRGSYAPLAPYLARLNVQQLVLEYATERAGEIVAIESKELGLGVTNPRTAELETTDRVRALVERALRHYPADRLFLNPDCGFGTFSNRPVNESEPAFAKLRVISEAASQLRLTHTPCSALSTMAVRPIP